MSTEGRVEYAQSIGADWQLPAAGMVVALVALAFVALTSPSGAVLPARQGPQGLNQPSRLGQLQPTQPPLQPNAGSTQRSTSPTTSGSGLQSAGSAETLKQFEGGR